MALREAVNEQDFGPIRIAPVLRGNGKTIGCLHRDRLELLLLGLARRDDGDEKSRNGNSGKLTPGGWMFHFEASLLRIRSAAQCGTYEQPLGRAIEIEGRQSRKRCCIPS